MSHRPTDKKKLRGLRKALRKTPPRYINLVEWLQDRGYANTAGGARQLLIDGKVRVDSHVVGREQMLTVNDADQNEIPFYRVSPLIDAKHRGSIVVL